jgi:hypothetical protein
MQLNYVNETVLFRQFRGSMAAFNKQNAGNSNCFIKRKSLSDTEEGFLPSGQTVDGESTSWQLFPTTRQISYSIDFTKIQLKNMVN